MGRIAEPYRDVVPPIHATTTYERLTEAMAPPIALTASPPWLRLDAPGKKRVAPGDVSDPPGYVQPSIATVRIWRTR